MIRCPSCGAGQLVSRTTCSQCQGSLTEIVAGYKDRLALAMDREQLEADGWRLLEVKEDVEGTPFSARFHRDAGTAPRPVRQRDNDPRISHGAQYWVLAFLVLITGAAAVGVVLRIRTYQDSNSSEAATTTQIATLNVDGGPGVLFAGTISDGTASRQINGAVPQSFDLESGVDYSFMVQKNNPDLGLLQLTITCANGSSTSALTTLPSGVLTLKAHCQ